DQPSSSISATTADQQVVHDDHTLPFLNGIFVYFQRTLAVFELVVGFGSNGWEFPRLPYRDEPGFQAVGQGRTKNKSAGFDAQHQVDFLLQVVLRQSINQRSKSDLVLEQRRDVVKQNSLLGKIRHFPDKLF